MDVRCARCNVEYEFDDANIPPGGVPVQCTNCGHVFRVGSDNKSGVDNDEWMVRQKDGGTIRFKELTTLQKWIVEQKVERTDEISRTGRTWRPLGDIAELSSFFQVVDAARSASSLARQGLVPGPGGASSTMPAPAAHIPAMMPAQPSLPHQPTPVNLQTRPAPAIHTASTEVFFAPDDDDGPSLDSLDIDDPVRQWRRRSQMRRAAMVFLVVVVLAAGIGFALRPDLVAVIQAKLGSFGGIDAALATRVEQALKGDLEGELEAVDHAVERAIADGADESLAHAFRARLLVARARASATVASTTVVDSERLERLARRDAFQKSAATHALSALTRDPGGPAAHLASAAVQAETGALLEMESDLQAAVDVDTSAEMASEAAVIRAIGLFARLTSDDDDARAENARRLDDALLKAKAVAGEDRRLVVVELLARRITAATDDEKAALVKSAQDAAARHPAHIGIQRLAAALTDAVPPTEAAVTVDDDKAKMGDASSAATTDAKDAKDTKKSDDEDDDVDEKKSGSASFDRLLAKANRLRMADRSRQALGLYRKASDLRPSDPRPHVGIGWASLDAESNTAALAAFKKAVSLDADLAEAHFGLAESHRAKSQNDAALSSYKTYLRLAPSGEEANAAKRAIETIEAAQKKSSSP